MRACIVGGGLAGSLLAWRLAQAASGWDIDLVPGERRRADATAAFRCPSGPLVDLVSVFNGRRLHDARELTVSTLIVRGDDDRTSTDSDARALLSDIRSRDKSYAAVAGGSHFLLLEKSRNAFYRALDEYFKPMKNRPRVVHEEIL